ncbi:MAG: hypothetical protein H0Z28_10150 [Archaeoglobus sp.]|nr:hypothetical protein [Archaeoglobus sp.]
MALCENCPAEKDFPELWVQECIAFGSCCPDDLYGVYGGDCYATFENCYAFEDELDEYDDPDGFGPKFEELYDLGEIRAKEVSK